MSSSELGDVKALLARILQTQERLETRFENIESRIERLEKPSSAAIAPIDPTSSALSISRPGSPEVTLCLDFGTARSKAFAMRGSSDEPLDLAIGARAGQSQSVHSLLSCVFIGDDGKFWFGEEAARRSEQAVSAGSRRRFESFKSMLTNASPGSDLRAIDCHKESNPTPIRLTDGDILTVYLAYLTDMAASELQTRHQISRHVRRRFTMPVFSTEHAAWGEGELRKHFAEAVLVADHFSGRWSDGIPAAEVAGVLLGATRRHQDVLFLIDGALVEPVAAFGSRFRDSEGAVEKRQLITIVDIGAGTTDFASFALMPDEQAGFKMFQIPGSVTAIRKAGDEVDRLLTDYILRQASVEHAGADESVLARVRADLRLRQRSHKERLFLEKDGRVEIVLSDDTKVVVERASFLAESNVLQFANALANAFIESLKGMDQTWIREFAGGEIVIVATGGGAQLPFVQSIGESARLLLPDLHGVKNAKPIPRWVSQEFPEMIGEYPQLAVAIGGAVKEVPRLAEQQYRGFGGIGGSEKWVIKPALKGT